MKKQLLKQFAILLLAVMGISLSVNAQEPVAVADREYTSIDELPATINGSLAEGDDIHALATFSSNRNHFADGFSFTLSESTTINILLESEDGDAGFDTYLELYDNEFNLVAENDDYLSQGSVSSIVQDLDAGTYYIIVTAFGQEGGRVQGPYTLNVKATNVLSFSEMNFEDTLTIPETTSSVWAQTLSTTADLIFNYKSGYNTYADGSVMIITETSNVDILLRSDDNTPFDPYLFLLDENFQVIAENDDYNGSARESHIRIMLAPGTYYVIVTTYDEYDVGDYTLSRGVVGGRVSYETITWNELQLATDESLTINEETPFFATTGSVVYNGEDLTESLNADMYAVGYAINDFGNVSSARLVLNTNDEIFALFYDQNTGEIIGINGTDRVVNQGVYVIIFSANQGDFTFSIDAQGEVDVYIDPLGGDDNNVGTDIGHPVKTLDRAVEIANGMGRFIIMNDLTIDNAYTVEFSLQMLPNRKEITITATENGMLQSQNLQINGWGYFEGEDFIILPIRFVNSRGNLLFDADRLNMQGINFENCKYNVLAKAKSYCQTNDCKFLNDTITTIFDVQGCDYVSLYNDTIRNCMVTSRVVVDADYLDMSYLGVENSKFDAFASVLEKLELSNSVFENDTLSKLFMIPSGTESVYIGSSSFSKCLVKDKSLFPFEEVQNVNFVELEVSDCKATTMAMFNECPNVSFDDITFLRNTSTFNEPSAPEWMNTTTMGGILLYNTEPRVYDAFVVDTNNYVMLVGSSNLYVYHLTENSIARLMTMSIDYGYNTDYAEGKYMLQGGSVSEVYQMFYVAQHDPNNTWSINANGQLTAGQGGNPDGIDDVAAANVKVYAVNNSIVINGAEGQPVSIYDVTGRTISAEVRCNATEIITAPHAGVYLVKVGTQPATRVVVMR